MLSSLGWSKLFSMPKAAGMWLLLHKPRQGVVASTLNLFPNGVVRLIVTSGSLISAAVVAETVRFQFSSNLRETPDDIDVRRRER
jgi:hypothetical protein